MRITMRNRSVMSMNAYRLFADGTRFEEVEEPTPQSGEVIIKIAGAGACHSDLHAIEYIANPKSFFTPPFTLGHENTGWIHALGTGVTTLHIGEPVAIYGAWGCGSCSSCVIGAESYCHNQATMRGGGLGFDGGMAAYMRVPAARYCLPLGNLEPRDAAPLSDAGLTPYHAIKRSLPLLTPDATVVVIGIGGLGHMAIQMLHALCAARIIAVDVAADKLLLAAKLGADETLLAGEDAREHFFALTNKQRADVVLDFVGAQSTIDLGRRIVRPNGDLSIVGLGGGGLLFAQGKVPWGARVSTPFYGTINELREVIALAARGRIHAHVTRYTLADAPKAYDAMRAGTLEGRAVICPNGVENAARP